MPNYFAELRNDQNFDPNDIEDLELISEENHSYLQESIAYRPEFVPYFISKSKNIDHQDDNGQTALQYMISRSMFGFAEDLLKKGASTSLIDKYGNDALWTSVLNPRPNIKLIKALVELGANPTRKNLAGRSSLDMARTKNNKAMLDIFGEQ